MRICYLARTDRGACVTGARLFGAQTDGRWSVTSAPDALAETAIGWAEEAATWVAERLASARPARHLDGVCIDSDGGICTWLTVPSGDPAVVAAAFAQAGAGDLAAHGGEGEGGLASAVQALPGISGITPRRAGRRRRGASSEDEGERVAVMALQDSAVRLFLDALDARRVGVGRVFSIWHALAEAWDPGAADAGQGSRPDRVVAAGSPLSAVVMLEPEGRIVWVWGRAGEVIAGGAMRLARAHAEADDGACRIGAADVGRLNADWLAWSAQIGTVPSRVVCVGPPAEAGAGSALATLAAGLRAGWPDAAVAAKAEADPVAATFHLLAQRAGAPSEMDPGRTVAALSRLPGRMHRAMHLWGAFVLVGCATVCGVLALRARAAAGELRQEAAGLKAEMKLAVEEFDAEIASADYWMRELRTELQQRTAPQRQQKTEPILPELENIALVLGGFASEGVEPLEISVDIVPLVRVRVPSLEMADEVSNAFLRGMRSAIQWRRSVGGSRPDQIDVTFTGAWASSRPAPEGGGE